MGSWRNDSGCPLALGEQRPGSPKLTRGLLPQPRSRGPNDLWQMDVTYIHLTGRGWWCAVTVIDSETCWLAT